VRRQRSTIVRPAHPVQRALAPVCHAAPPIDACLSQIHHYGGRTPFTARSISRIAAPIHARATSIDDLSRVNRSHARSVCTGARTTRDRSPRIADHLHRTARSPPLTYAAPLPTGAPPHVIADPPHSIGASPQWIGAPPHATSNRAHSIAYDTQSTRTRPPCIASPPHAIAAALSGIGAAPRWIGAAPR
jgi:hypothetical protein